MPYIAYIAHRTDVKRPDGATLILWSHSKPLELNVTVSNTFAYTYITSSAANTKLATDKAASVQTKYIELSHSHRFSSFALETLGP